MISLEKRGCAREKREGQEVEAEKGPGRVLKIRAAGQGLGLALKLLPQGTYPPLPLFAA